MLSYLEPKDFLRNRRAPIKRPYVRSRFDEHSPEVTDGLFIVIAPHQCARCQIGWMSIEAARRHQCLDGALLLGAVTTRGPKRTVPKSSFCINVRDDAPGEPQPLPLAPGVEIRITDLVDSMIILCDNAS